MDASHASPSLEEIKYELLKRLYEDEKLSHAARTFCARLIILYGGTDTPITHSSRVLAELCYVASGHVGTILQELKENGKHVQIERVGTGTWAKAHISFLPPTQVTSTPHRQVMGRLEVVNEQAGHLVRDGDLCSCKADQ